MTIRVVQGHAPDVLSQMEAESCHLCVTSPPYWNLRSYSTPPQIWPNPDGTPLCADGAHEWDAHLRPGSRGGDGISGSTLGGGKDAQHFSAREKAVTSHFCSRCGCWRGELGQEPTVERYIADLVFVFDAVRRVLRRDGLCWVNLSGSYFNNPGGQNGGSLRNGEGASTLNGSNPKLAALHRISAKAIAANGQVGRQDRIGAAGKGSWLKPLDWVETPGLFAHAMQRAGWYWRADIALVKKAPLPESVTGWKWERCRVKVTPQPKGERQKYAALGLRDASGGITNAEGAQWADCPGCDKCSKADGLILRRGNGRPTRAWERFLVFAKAPGAYWDSDAVREPHADPERGRRTVESGTPHHKGSGDAFREVGISWVPGVRQYHPAGRNLKDWQFWPTTGGVGGLQHYAAFPLGLPSLAIRAGTSERGVCGTCGAPWARVVETRRGAPPAERGGKNYGANAQGTSPSSALRRVGGDDWYEYVGQSETTGWRPTCGHDAPASPAVVLDPFVGAGTTLIAADRLGRDAIGIDVQPTYIDLAAGRARRDAPLFATVEVEGQAEQASKQRDLFSVLEEQEGVADAAG